MKTAEANNTQTESRAAANVEQAASQPMVMGDWKQWVFNGEVINNSSEDITVWSDDDGTYTIPAGGNSETWGEDVDHVRDVHGQWWKVGWNTATVDSNGEVSGAECRAPGRGQDCGQLGDYPSPSEDTVQTKLTANQPNDRFEQEADAVAEKVVSGEGSIQRKCTDCEQEDELQMKPLVQLKANSSESGQEVRPWVQQQIESSRGSGQPLRDETRSFMENGIGAGFESVKIHTDSQAVQMNRELGARAFTVGNDIYFNSGQYSPETGEGKKLLAHELTHTVQQGTSTEGVQRDVLEMPEMRVRGGGVSDRSALAGDNADPSGMTITPDQARIDASSQLATTALPFTASGWDSNQILQNLGQYDRIPGTDSDAVRCVQAVGLVSHIQMGIGATRNYLTSMSLQGALRPITPRNRTALDVLDLVKQRIEDQTATYGDLYWAMESMHAMFNKDDEGTDLTELHDVINPAFDLSMTMQRQNIWCANNAEIMAQGNALANGEQLMLNTWRVSFNIRFEDIPGREEAERARYTRVREGERDRTVTIRRLHITDGTKPAHTDIDENRDSMAGHQLMLYKDAADGHLKLYDPELTVSGGHMFDLTADSSALNIYFNDQPDFEMFEYVQILGKMTPSNLLSSP